MAASVAETETTDPRTTGRLDAVPVSTPPDGRGRLDVASRVVEKVAARAALTCDGVQDTSQDRGRVGEVVQRVVHSDLPSASADVGAGAVRLRLRVAVRWPTSLPDTADLVRRTVTSEVGRVTGLRVDGVDVSVTAVASAQAPAEASGRRVR